MDIVAEGVRAIKDPCIEVCHEATTANVDAAKAGNEANEDTDGEGDDHRRRGVGCSRRRGGGVDAEGRMRHYYCHSMRKAIINVDHT